ncbi:MULTISPECIES: SusC/RagA family TonB-linked outer membrane protein [Myroides]|uniref:SusC/RagA family TonB-linked outer membrane protein n=1 Tax=Myroides TaxID=76831 RepID=UPI000280A3EC|nr:MULTISPECIES: SusC/RagA family TonB-linked outer membrane protein [Myroides]APA91234.1 SusC/RagA family TonB-linked outer membrane protein [Myroides sp. ZB35]EKB02424.1 SusC/RagA family TonB-linked outer membrane protein [Myroides odoratimimus CCUG 3837]
MKKSRLNWFYASLLLLSVSAGYAQDKKLTGVVSEGGTPLPGVSVTIQGTNHGTQTDLDGNYSLNVKPGDVLVFSFIGMKDITYKVGQASIYNPSLSSEDNQLTEVVVLAYGQSKGKNEVTGNVVTVKGDVIAKTPVVSVDQALQGRVAGLQMATTSGSPGATQNIRIRGRNSLSANNEPLFVVDGVPLTSGNISGNDEGTSLSSLSGINSEDIETMTVLKDAAATAAYGARGGNGVILITTKKGKRGEPSYNLKASVGFQNFARKGPKFLSGEQKKELWLESNYNTLGEKLGFTMDNVWDWYTGYYGPNNQLTRWVANGSQDNNWRDAVLNKDALTTTVSLGVNGGDEKGTYYANFAHEKFDGVVIGSDFRKVSGAFNMTRQLNDRLDIKIGANVSNILQNGINEGGAYFSNPNLSGMFISPWAPIYNEDGSHNLNLPGGLHNPLYVTDNNIARNDVIRVISNNSLGYKLLDDLKFESTIGLDYLMANYKTYLNPIHGDGESYYGSASETDRKRFNYVWQNSLNYKFYLGDSHKFDTRVLMEYQKNKANLLQGSGEVLPPGMISVGASAANYIANARYTDWVSLGFLGLLNYSYNDKYLLDLTLRREGSSRFSESDRWGTFFAVGGAWNISSESFMNDVEFVNLLRLRGSVGTTGNSEIESNTYAQLLQPGKYNGESAMVSSQFGGLLGWEKQLKTDVGIEFGLFDNRLTGSFTYFHSKSKDLLYARPLSRTSGFNSQWTNLGDLTNSGIEIELNYDVFRTEDFNWSIGGNIGTVKNKMVTMPIVDGKPLKVLGSFKGTEEGKALEEWRLKEYAGVDAQTGLAQWYMADGSKTTNYNAAETRYQNKSALPKLTGAVNTHIEYKGVYLDALFSFATGYSVYDYWSGYTNAVNATSLNSFNGTTELMERWQKPGDITDVPKLTNGGGGTYTSPSTRWLYDGDHIRLKQITLGYNLKSTVAKSMGLDAVNLSVSARNPLTWVKDSRLKWDPEVDATGYIEMATPPLKSFVFTLNVKF